MAAPNQLLKSRDGERRGATKDEPHLPFPGSLQLADLAQHKIALERTDAEDEENPIQVIDFMLKGARQQLVGFPFKPIALHILGAYFDLRGASDFLANIRQAETALLLEYFPFFGDHLGIDQGDLVLGGLLEAEIDHCQT